MEPALRERLEQVRRARGGVISLTPGLIRFIRARCHGRTWPDPTPHLCGAPSRSRAGRPFACAWPGRPTARWSPRCCERRGLPADDLDVRRLLAFDPARRHVLCALAPLDGAEVLAGLGAIDFGEDAPDVLVVDERFAPGLGELLGRVLIERSRSRRAA